MTQYMNTIWIRALLYCDAMDSLTMQTPAVVQRTDSNPTLSTMSPIINLPKMVREQKTKSPIQPVQSVVQNNETANQHT